MWVLSPDVGGTIGLFHDISKGGDLINRIVGEASDGLIKSTAALAA
jgi:hypothetical protein